KMGLRANVIAELLFVVCFVSTEILLGGAELYENSSSSISGGYSVAIKTSDSTRSIVASLANGIARDAYVHSLDVVKQDYPKSGRYFRLASEILAEAKQDIDAARLLTWEAAWKADMGLENAYEAAMCKAYSGQMALDVCAKCLELLGPSGLDGQIVEKLYR